MSANFTPLYQAIRRRAAAVILGRAGGAACRFEVKLDCEFDPEGNHGVWADLVNGDVTLLDRLIAAHSPIQVTLDCGRYSVCFDSSLLGRQRKRRHGEQVLIGWPGKLNVRERRRSERVPVPENVTIPTRLIRTDRLPAHDGDLPLTVLDLSTTGAGLLCPVSDLQLEFGPGEGLEICMLLMGVERWIAARHRHTQRLPDGRVRIGVEFAPDAGLDPKTQSLINETIESFKTQQVRSTLGSMLGRPAHCSS